MNLEQIIEQLEQEVRDVFSKVDVCHDIDHLRRTMNNAIKIQEKEGGDKTIIAIAAFLHDVHRVIQKNSGVYCTPKDSLPKVKEILDKIELTDTQKEKILHCVEYHEEYGFSKDGKTVDDIETLIVQDADNLDAIGAIGIGRTFLYSGAYDIPMWNTNEPFDKGLYEDDNHDPSVVHHFHSKLLKLKDNMNTETARQMAESRHKFMEVFLKELFDEWKGSE
jgi:uncharacterized protein